MMKNLIEVSKMRDVEGVRELVANGANLEGIDSGGWTALHWAADFGHADIVEILLDSGAEIEKSDFNGWTALHWAAERGQVEATRVLIKKGADVNKADSEGKTPLHRACQCGHLETALCLVEEGADQKVRDNDNWTALDLTVACNNKTTYRILVEKGAGAPMPEIFTHIYYGALEEIKELVEKDPSIVVKKMDEKTEMYPIHLASWVGSVKTIKLLLYHGADTSVCDSKGLTAFDYAEKSVNREEVLEVLKQGTGAEKE
jgi:uncharacterized protein